MKKINTDKLKNRPIQPLDPFDEPDATSSQTEKGFETIRGTETPEENNPILKQNNKKKKQPKKGNNKTAVIVAIGFMCVAGLFLVLSIVKNTTKQPSTPIVQNNHEVPVTENQHDSLSTDVSGLLTLDERNQARTFETFTDQYINLQLEAPSDYYLTERSHLDLDIIKEAQGSVATNSYKGTVEVVELKSKQYANMTMVLQVNHRKDFPKIDTAVQNGEFIATTHHFYNGSDSKAKVQEALGELPVPEEGVEQQEEVTDDEKEKAVDGKEKESNAVTTEEQPKTNPEEDKKEKPTQAKKLVYEDLATWTEEKYRNEQGELVHRLVFDKQNFNETIIKPLAYGSYKTTTTEKRNKEEEKKREVTSIPYYLAYNLPQGFIQINDHSKNVCLQDAFIPSKSINLLDLDFYNECYTYNGTGYILKEGYVLNTANRAVTLADMEKANTTKEETTNTEKVDENVSTKSEVENKEETPTGEETNETVTEEEQANVEIGIYGEAEKEEVKSEYTEEEQAELDRLSALLGLDTTEQEDVVILNESVNNDIKEIGNYVTFAKRVDLLYLGEYYVAYEYAFSVGANMFYLTVYGEAKDEIYYLLEDAEQLIKSLVIL